MNRYGAALALGGLFVGMVVMADGCTLSPFTPPSYEEAKGNAGGGNGAGGNGGVGGSAGNGGAGGSCTCDSDENECTQDACVDGVCKHDVLLGSSCSLGGFCDESGTCAACLDCTAEACTHRCDGTTCADGAQCDSTICDPSGVCCNGECLAPCASCNLAGIPGTCTPLPKGIQVTDCTATKACNEKGECVDLPTTGNFQKPLGATCSGSNDCFSGACSKPYCRVKLGDYCNDDVECVTNLCNQEKHVCESCTDPEAGPGPYCAAGSTCISGSCQALLGQPCDTGSDCASGTCLGKLCSLGLGNGDPCNVDAECSNANCINSKCMDCNMDSDCGVGRKCTNFACLLPKDAYCVLDTQCTSGKCTGFPRRCQ